MNDTPFTVLFLSGEERLSAPFGIRAVHAAPHPRTLCSGHLEMKR